MSRAGEVDTPLLVRRSYLGLWTLLIKCIGVILSVGSGMLLGQRTRCVLHSRPTRPRAAGKEGPFVHIAACFANVLARWFPKYRDNHSKRNEIISAGVAAGVRARPQARPPLRPQRRCLLCCRLPSRSARPSAACCSAWRRYPPTSRTRPCGARSSAPSSVRPIPPRSAPLTAGRTGRAAALVLKYVDPSQTGKLVVFQIDYDLPWCALAPRYRSISHPCARLRRKWFEVLPFALIGVLGGIFGVIFIK